MVSEAYTLDVTPGGEPLIIPVSQYDNDTREITVTLYANGAPYTIPTAALVTVQGTKQDMTGFQYYCTYSGSDVTFAIKSQMTVFAGRVPCEVSVTQGENILGTANFILAVEPAPLRDDIIVSETDLPIINNMPVWAGEAEAYGTGKRGGVDVGPDDPAYHNNAPYYAGIAGDEATAASGSATSAATSAGNAEAWAVGQRGGTDVPDTDPTYHNNSKYYSGQASTTAATVASTTATTILNNSLSGLKFGQDGQGNWGYMVGGQPPVIPFEHGGGSSGHPLVAAWYHMTGDTSRPAPQARADGYTVIDPDTYSITFTAAGAAVFRAQGLNSYGSGNIDVYLIKNSTTVSTKTFVSNQPIRADLENVWSYSFTAAVGDVIEIDTHHSERYQYLDFFAFVGLTPS